MFLHIHVYISVKILSTRVKIEKHKRKMTTYQDRKLKVLSLENGENAQFKWEINELKQESLFVTQL